MGLSVKDLNKDIHFRIYYFIFRFTKVLKSLKMNEPSFKVTESRIYSLAIHPSETSLIIATGDKKGNIGEIMIKLIPLSIVFT